MYTVPPLGILVPSVTTIVRMGSDAGKGSDAPSNRFVDQGWDYDAAHAGKLFHAHMEIAVTTGLRPAVTNISQEEISAVAMANLGMLGMKPVTLVHGTEATVWFGDLYAGTADMFCDWRGNMAVLDYKSGSRLRTLEEMDAALMQCAAYGMAHDWMFGTKTETAVIISVSKFGEGAMTKVVTGAEYERACTGFLDTLSRYYKRFA